MSRTNPPPSPVLEAARARAEARRAKDWATADRLRADIEAAGWRVVDRGESFALEPAHPPDLESDVGLRYGRSDSVPSRLDAPPTATATIVMVVGDRARGVDAVASVEASLLPALALAPAGVEAVVVADGLADEALDALRDLAAAPDRDRERRLEVIATSAPLGQAAALNAGIRRAGGATVVALDPSIEPESDIVTPLIAALEDPSVAIAGPFGLATADLRRFEEVVAIGSSVDAAAIEGYLMAFRRADASARGPLDEHFRFYRNLDIWWSLVLRDEGPGAAPRRAAVVPGLELRRGEPRAWSVTPAAERERRSKRNFYRVLERFRTRLDLAVEPSPG